MADEIIEEPLDSQDFYELMQAYRHTTMANQSVVVRRFEDVKDFVREHYAKPLRTAKEFIAEHVGVEPELEHDSVERN